MMQSIFYFLLCITNETKLFYALPLQPSILSCPIAIASLHTINTAHANDDTNHKDIQVLATIVVKAQGNWLENANAEKVQQHAGARTIINRKR